MNFINLLNMLDVFLKEYQISDSSSPYNAPHRFRSALKKGLATYLYMDAWNSYNKSVLQELVDAVKSKIDTTSKFAFALAPSNIKVFVSDIELFFIKSFPNAINFSECFQKINGFEAGLYQREMTDYELKNSIKLNRKCFENKAINSVGQILLIDDVYSFGNTFKGMKNEIELMNKQIKIYTAVILKTT